MAGGIERVLFFDFDGTLIDSMGQHVKIFGDMLARSYGLDAETAGLDYLSMAGKPLEAQFHHALEHGGVTPGGELTELIAEFWRRYGELEPLLFPEVAEVLPELASRYPLVITSQGRQDMIESKLRQAGVRQHFELVLGIDPMKPGIGKGVGHFRLAREALGISSAGLQASIMTGDGAFDMEVARRAKMTAIGRLTGDNGEVLRAAGAQFLVSDLHELAATIRLLSDHF